MNISGRPIFSSDWPRYAVAAQIAFWATSALFIASFIGAMVSIVPAGAALFAFILLVGTIPILGLAALFSGKLYFGNQVFVRSPFTGVSARLVGAFMSVGGSVAFTFIFGVMQIRGG
jgi:hypothetical protein